MKKIGLGLAIVVTMVGCTPPGPPSPTPAPEATPPVSEQCAANHLTCGCWDLPPTSPEWLWVCCSPYKHVTDSSQCGGAPCPTPTPSASPKPPDICRTTRVDEFKNQLKAHSGQQIDYTVVACGGDVVRTNHNCAVNCCELSVEKGNQACADRLYGMPAWYPSQIKLIQMYEDNTYTQKVVEGETGATTGKVRVCGHASGTPGNCVVADVVVGSPACTDIPGSTQGCGRNVGQSGLGAKR